MRTNRTYPTYVDRNIPVPDWAKIPFVPKGLPPVFVFPIGSAKSIAKHEWTRQFGELIPSEAAIKKFVFSFHWRWRGDQARRYEILARWAYEFVAIARQEQRRIGRNSAKIEDSYEIQLTDLGHAWLCSEAGEPPDPQLLLPLRPGRPASGRIKRAILLNPLTCRRGKARKTPRR